MQCVVMAGGLGTRMARLTSTMPKAMIPVAGEPFVRHQLRLLASGGFDDIVIATGYLGEKIVAEVLDHSPDGVSVRCVPDGPQLLGTAGALRRLSDLNVLEPVFAIVYGDSYLLVDYESVCSAFDPANFSALMTVIRNDRSLDVSNATFEEGKVSLYRKGVPDPESQGMQFIDYGLSIMTEQTIRKLVPAGAVCDLAVVFETLSMASMLQGVEAVDRFFEIGSERGLADLERLLHRKAT
jgi:NDP-sugar pyrophosphorylase family protein